MLRHDLDGLLVRVGLPQLNVLEDRVEVLGVDHVLGGALAAALLCDRRREELLLVASDRGVRIKVRRIDKKLRKVE